MSKLNLPDRRLSNELHTTLYAKLVTELQVASWICLSSLIQTTDNYYYVKFMFVLGLRTTKICNPQLPYVDL
jgi:hypothetical protein